MRSTRALLALNVAVAVWLAGCTASQPEPSAPASAAGAAAVETPPEPQAAPPPSGATFETPPSAPPRISPSVTTVAILYSGSASAQAAIAARIGEGLAGPMYIIRRIDVDGLDTDAPSGARDAADEADASIVAAIGPSALDIACKRFVRADIVFSQALEPRCNASHGRIVRGVAPMPPETLQLAAWAKVDPGLKRVGLITSRRFAKMVPAARQAAAAVGAELVNRVSTSDLETLYLFRRIAGEIDGLWLMPDREILSMAAINEILEQAAELDVGVLVFSENLLDRGGLISVGASPEHVAGTVIDAIERIRAGRGATLPTEIPLAQGAVHVNARVAAELGLPAGAATEWVIGDGN